MKSFRSIFIITILIGTMYVAGQLSAVSAASEFDFSAGDLSGSFLADISNVNYTDMSAASILSVSNLNSQKSYTLDQAVIRAAFSIRAAVILMDAHDNMWEQKLGTSVFTAVPGTSFTSTNWMDFRDYFLEDNGDFKSGAYITKDGNATLNEDSYRANLDSKAFLTSDYDGLNSTEVENLDTMYDDLTDDLLEADEEETDAKEEANDLVVAGFDNLEATILEILKKKVANDDSVNVPASQIRIDNYTLTNLYHEQIMSAGLADTIIKSYDEAKTAGFLDTFKKKIPLKFSRVAIGQKMTAFKDSVVGSVKTATAKTFEAVKGSTAVTTALAFKDKIVKGTISAIVGVKESVRTGFSKITNGFSKIKEGTKKLISKATSWFSGFATKAKKFLKWGLVILLIVIVVYVLYQAYMMKQFSGMRR